MGSNQTTSSRNLGNQMTEPPLASWPKWRDDLILQLRRKHLSGERIGDILYEVDAHLRESGETPEEAFGDPQAYASSRAANERASAARPSRRLSVVDILRMVLIPAVGGSLLATGAFNLGAGSDDWGGWGTWPALIVGAALLALTFATLPDDLIKHPRTGQPLFGSRGQIYAIITASFVLMATVVFALGWFLIR